MILLQVAQLHSLTVALVPMPDPFNAQLQTLATAIRDDARALGLIIFVISVIIAGIMRMVAFGSERRIALSNMALTAAVVGLIILLMSVTILGFLQGVIH